MIVTVRSTDSGAPFRKVKNRAAQNVLNFLKTFQGETPFARGLGIPPEMLHMRVTEARDWLLANLPTLLAQYVPEAAVQDVRILSRDGAFIIEVDVDE